MIDSLPQVANPFAGLVRQVLDAAPVFVPARRGEPDSNDGTMAAALRRHLESAGDWVPAAQLGRLIDRPPSLVMGLLKHDIKSGRVRVTKIDGRNFYNVGDGSTGEIAKAIALLTAHGYRVVRE